MDEMLDRLVYKNEASGLTYVAEIRKCAPLCCAGSRLWPTLRTCCMSELPSLGVAVGVLGAHRTLMGMLLLTSVAEIHASMLRLDGPLALLTPACFTRCPACCAATALLNSYFEKEVVLLLGGIKGTEHTTPGLQEGAQPVMDSVLPHRTIFLHEVLLLLQGQNWHRTRAMLVSVASYGSVTAGHGAPQEPHGAPQDGPPGVLHPGHAGAGRARGRGGRRQGAGVPGGGRGAGRDLLADVRPDAHRWAARLDRGLRFRVKQGWRWPRSWA